MSKGALRDLTSSKKPVSGRAATGEGRKGERIEHSISLNKKGKEIDASKSIYRWEAPSAEKDQKKEGTGRERERVRDSRREAEGTGLLFLGPLQSFFFSRGGGGFVGSGCRRAPWGTLKERYQPGGLDF